MSTLHRSCSECPNYSALFICVLYRNHSQRNCNSFVKQTLLNYKSQVKPMTGCLQLSTKYNQVLSSFCFLFVFCFFNHLGFAPRSWMESSQQDESAGLIDAFTPHKHTHSQLELLFAPVPLGCFYLDLF